jgi:hypothetical protein
VAVITETREIRGCDEVVLCGHGELVVEQTEGSGSDGTLVIEADESLMPKITSEVRGRRLLLGIRMPWYEWISAIFSLAFLSGTAIRYRLKIGTIHELAIAGSGRIICAALRTDSCRLRISGSGTIMAEAMRAGLLEAHIAGSGDIRCAGEAEKVSAEITGSGSVQAERLEGQSVRVGISGSGSAAVHAVQSLDVRITGSGAVSYRGSPTVSSRITGSGRVRHSPAS